MMKSKGPLQLCGGLKVEVKFKCGLLQDEVTGDGEEVEVDVVLLQ